MSIFGVKISKANSTDFFVVSADSEDEATALFTLEGDVAEVCDLESMLIDQYDGAALLSTV